MLKRTIPKNRQVLLVLVLTMLPNIVLFAQAGGLERAAGYIRKAEDYYAAAKYEASIKEYQFAARIYRESNRPDRYAVSYNGVGNNYIELTRFNEAKQEFDRVLALYAEAAQGNAGFKADSSLVADALEGLGRFRMNVNVNYDSALAYHLEALRLRLKLHGEADARVAKSYYFMAACYRGLAQDSSQNILVTQERDILEKALNIQLKALGEDNYQVADTYQAIGDYYYQVQRDYQRGYDYHQKALDIRRRIFGDEHPKIASSYLDLATYYRAINMYERELELLEEALVMQKKILGDYHKDLARNYLLLGNRYRAVGDYEVALTDYRRALAIYEKLGSGRSAEVAEVLHFTALCYRALEMHNEEYLSLLQALDMRRSIYGKAHYLVADSYTELGAYYGQKQRNDSLLFYYKQAADLLEQQLGLKHPLVAQAYDNLAKAHRSLGDSEQELAYLQKALQIKEEASKVQMLPGARLGPQDLEDESNRASDLSSNAVVATYSLYSSYLNLAKYHYGRKSFNAALQQCQNALAAVSETLNFGDTDLFKNPSNKDLSHNIEWMEALNLKGEILLSIYLEAGQKMNYLEAASRTFEQALDLVDTLRINFGAESSKQQLTKQSMPVYEGMLRSLQALYEAKKEVRYQAELFEVIERSRAFLLLQALQNIQAKNTANISAELLVKEELLRRQMAYYANYKNRTAENQKQFDEEYLRIRTEYDALIKQIRQQYPEYFVLKHQNEVISVAQVQKELLGRKDALLEYFMGDDWLFIVLILPDKLIVKQLPMPKKVVSTVTALRLNLSDYQLIARNQQLSYANFVSSARDCYEMFFAPIAEDIPNSTLRLTLVPDGMLNYIPFEVLLSSQPVDKGMIDYTNLDYLIKRYEFNYSYSATLLQRKKRQGRRANNMKCLGFAPSYEGLSEDLVNLPGAERELKGIEKIFNGKYFYGKEATKAEFKRELGSYGIIHLATHGSANTKNPLNSTLAFAKGSDSREDAALFAYEIHNLDLRTNLVVLSACETGFGRMVKGEGVLSLARAFIYAGAPSVVTTLWKVNDVSSSALMSFFYHNLAKGMSKPEAMRQAKLQYLENADMIAGHPAFWSSFITIGDPSPVKIGWPWWVWTLIILALGAFWQLYGRQRWGAKIGTWLRLRLQTSPQPPVEPANPVDNSPEEAWTSTEDETKDNKPPHEA